MTVVRIGTKIRRASCIYKVGALDTSLKRLRVIRLTSSPLYEKYIELLAVCNSPEIANRIRNVFKDLPEGLNEDVLFSMTAEDYWLPYDLLVVNGFTHFDHSKINAEDLP